MRQETSEAGQRCDEDEAGAAFLSSFVEICLFMVTETAAVVWGMLALAGVPPPADGLA